MRGERIGAGARGGGRCARPAAAFKALRARSAAAAPAPEVRGPASGVARGASRVRGGGVRGYGRLGCHGLVGVVQGLGRGLGWEF